MSWTTSLPQGSQIAKPNTCSMGNQPGIADATFDLPTGVSVDIYSLKHLQHAKLYNQYMYNQDV